MGLCCITATKSSKEEQCEVCIVMVQYQPARVGACWKVNGQVLD